MTKGSTTPKRVQKVLRGQEQLTVRTRQQAAVAELGQRALAGADLSTLMDEAVTLVAQILQVEYCKVLELLPDGGALLLRAGVGWKEGYVGHATVGANTDSQAGYTLLSGEPAIVKDLRTETRFSGPPLLHEHGVVSGMSVIIHGRHRPFGVLGAHTTRRRTFTRDDIHFLQAVANVLAEAIERRRAEEALRQSEKRYRSLFEDSLVSLWEEDFSAVKTHIDSLRGSGVKDFRAYFENHPEAVANCATMVKVVDVSEATLELYKARSKEDFRDGLGVVFGEESYNVFRAELVALAEGKTRFESEAINQTLTGDKIHIRLRWTVAPGHEKTLSKVLVSIIDITELKQAQEALRESEERFRRLAEAPFEGIPIHENGEGQATVALVTPPPGRGASLTPRQREVLEHIVAGRTNDQIARRLVVSRRTVERHVAAIFDKLGVENRAAAAAVAVAAGLARVKPTSA